MMRICSIASSSSGNCIYVGSTNTHLLIDVGISGKKVKSGLDLIGITPEKIDGILITHEHSDHIKGLGVMARRYGIPIYATLTTWNKIIESNKAGSIDEKLYHEITADTDFIVNEISIHPFHISHDAVEPVCYSFRKGEKKISMVTDLGCYDDYIKNNIKESNVLFIEANHDVQMLRNGSYPEFTKQRILSNKGHLSNETSGRLISELMHEKLEYVMLGHLSCENNDPRVALKSVKAQLDSNQQDLFSNEGFIVSGKDEVSDMVSI